MLIRIPKTSEAEEITACADISFQSQSEVIKSYSQKTSTRGSV
ncbi:hypothetical protein [Lutispora thermophila]|nr:hypothetical protein [Lutispora thermophila]